jgi:FKBP-type peptidyl-prolyl cis-trans isomerase FkpA
MAPHSQSYAFGLAFALLAGCGGQPPGAAPSAAAPAVAEPVANTLQIGELKPGAGAAIADGQKAVVQYTGWLYETSAPDRKGKEFDSSRNSGQPFSFVVGAGQVIKGWDQGVLGMKVGGRRRLVIPADLAYGDVGAAGVIPPGATLVFDVDLVAIE